MSIGWVHNIQTAHGKWAVSSLFCGNRPCKEKQRQHPVLFSCSSIFPPSVVADQCEKARARLDIVTTERAHVSSAPCVRHSSCGSKMWWGLWSKHEGVLSCTSLCQPLPPLPALHSHPPQHHHQQHSTTTTQITSGDYSLHACNVFDIKESINGAKKKIKECM